MKKGRIVGDDLVHLVRWSQHSWWFRYERERERENTSLLA